MAGGVVQRLKQRLALLARPRAAERLPVRLHRRRVYVVPSGFGLFYGALLLCMLIGALNYNNNPALLLALLLAAAGIASLITATLQLGGLQVDAVSAEPVHAGHALRLRIALQRTDARPRRGLRVAYGDAVGRATLAGDQTQAEVELDVPTERRGWFVLDRLRISTTQPLGLALAWSWIWPETPLLVYPRPEQDGPPLPDADGNASQARLHPAGDDLHHLRTYRSGDARRAIAWKSSARRDILLVREYERPAGIEVTLDWRALPGLDTERRIARLTRWVEEADRDGRRYKLILPQQPPLGPAHGPAHRHACLRALALLPHG